MQWGQPFRLSNLASGKFLGIKDDHIVLVDSKDANREVSAFCFVKKSVSQFNTLFSNPITSIDQENIDQENCD